MSESKRRRRPSSPAPRKGLTLALVALGLALVGATVFFVRQGDRAATASAGSGGPRVQVATDTFDYGEVRYNTPIETVFRVENVGDRPLEILGTPEVELVEGC